MRWWRVAGLLLLLLGLPLLSYLLPSSAARRPRSADDRVLYRRVQSLEALVARAEKGPLLERADVLVGVHEHLVQDVLSAVLPIDVDVGRGYRLRLESALARFEDGVALVRFDARAARGRLAPFADLRLFAGIDGVTLDPGSGELRGRLTVFAFDVPRLGVGGRARDVERLLGRLGPAGLEALAAWLPAVPIPVVLHRSIPLPEVRGDVVHIPAADVPVRLVVRDVDVVGRRLWVALADAPGSGEGAPAAVAAILQPPGAAREPGAVPLAIASLGCARARPPDEVPDPGELRQRRELALTRLDALVRGEPMLQQALAEPGEVVLALHRPFVEALVARAASTYLRDVRVSLRQRVVRRQGEERRRTPFGTVGIGQWEASVSLDGVAGRVEAGAPEVKLVPGNTISVTIPVRVPTLPASAAVRLAWDSKGLANVVCRDFVVAERVQGVVPALEDEVRGGFVLSMDGPVLVAQPFFVDRTLQLGARVSAESWAAVRAALEGEDRLFRCGIGLKPGQVIDRLRAVVARGFHARLPMSLFDPVRLPARFAPSARIGSRDVAFDVAARAVRVDGQGLWAGVRLHALAAAVAAEAPPAGAGQP